MDPTTVTFLAIPGLTRQTTVVNLYQDAMDRTIAVPLWSLVTLMRVIASPIMTAKVIISLSRSVMNVLKFSAYRRSHLWTEQL